MKLSLAVGTENVNELVLNHLLNLSASNGEVSSGVKYGGLVCHHAADTCGHSETDIGVDIDLANCHACSLAKLFFRNTNSIRQSAAEFVDFLNIFLGYGGSAVENDREAGESLFDLFENIEAKRRRMPCSFLVHCLAVNL